jgi:hypothetical protein
MRRNEDTAVFRGVIAIQTWFVLAVISPLLWAMCNHIDKIVLDRYFKEGGVGTLIIVSALASVIATPFLYLIDPSVLDVGEVISASSLSPPCSTSSCSGPTSTPCSGTTPRG